MDGYTYTAYDYPLMGAFWTIMWIFLGILFFFLLFRVITDLFRDDGLGGWAKTGWLVLLIVFPVIGILVYVITRGQGMGGREREHVRAQQQVLDTYIRETAGTTGRPSTAEELAKLSEVRARGGLSDEEFRQAKEKVLH